MRCGWPHRDRRALLGAERLHCQCLVFRPRQRTYLRRIMPRGCLRIGVRVRRHLQSGGHRLRSVSALRHGVAPRSLLPKPLDSSRLSCPKASAPSRRCHVRSRLRRRVRALRRRVARALSNAGVEACRDRKGSSAGCSASTERRFESGGRPRRILGLKKLRAGMRWRHAPGNQRRREARCWAAHLRVSRSVSIAQSIALELELERENPNRSELAACCCGARWTWSARVGTVGRGRGGFWAGCGRRRFSSLCTGS